MLNSDLIKLGHAIEDPTDPKFILINEVLYICSVNFQVDFKGDQVKSGLKRLVKDDVAIPCGLKAMLYPKCKINQIKLLSICLLYTSPSPRDQA